MLCDNFFTCFNHASGAAPNPFPSLFWLCQGFHASKRSPLKNFARIFWAAQWIDPTLTPKVSTSIRRVFNVFKTGVTGCLSDQRCPAGISTVRRPQSGRCPCSLGFQVVAGLTPQHLPVGKWLLHIATSPATNWRHQDKLWDQQATSALNPFQKWCHFTESYWIILNPHWTLVLEPKQQKWGYWYPRLHAIDITIIPRAVPDLEAPQQTGSSVNGGMAY